MQITKSLVRGGMIALIALAAMGTADSASAENQVTNSGFESGDLTGWEVAGASGSAGVSVVGTDNGPSAPGSNVAYLANFAEATGLTLKQTTTPGGASGGTVFYTFDLKLGQAELGGVFFVEIFAEQTGVGIVGGSGLLGNFTPADWTTIQGSFVAPAGTDFLTIQFTAVTGAVIGGSSTMYVDNVGLGYQQPIATDDMNWGELKSQHK